MSYLLDKKIKRKRLIRAGLAILLLIILFYFRQGVWKGLSYASQTVFHPVLSIGSGIGEGFKSFGSYFVSKSSLYRQNEHLQSELDQAEAKMLNYDSLAADDASIKAVLGRKDPKVTMVMAAILSKPNQSPYDTLVIDAGTEEGIQAGNTVFGFGTVPIGRISDVYPASAKVILFSNSGEKTQVVVHSVPPATGDASKDVSMEIIGRGGGNFEMVLPRDVTLQKGDEVVLPGINPYVVAIAQTVISDPRDPFTKALLVSPVNVEELKFVEVAK